MLCGACGIEVMLQTRRGGDGITEAAHVGQQAVRVGEMPLIDVGVHHLRQPLVDFLGLRLQRRGAGARRTCLGEVIGGTVVARF